MMPDMQNWGPSHQVSPSRTPSYKWIIRGFVALAVIGILNGGTPHNAGAVPIALAGAFVAVIAWFGLPTRVQQWTLAPLRRVRARSQHRRVAVRGDQLSGVRERALRLGGGVYLGLGPQDAYHARPERAVLIVGPPRRARRAR